MRTVFVQIELQTDMRTDGKTDRDLPNYSMILVIIECGIFPLKINYGGCCFRIEIRVIAFFAVKCVPKAHGNRKKTQ